LCKREISSVLPSNPVQVGGEKAITAISGAYGSALVCLISYGYICMLGSEGITDATKYAILNKLYESTFRRTLSYFVYWRNRKSSSRNDFRL
jgi:glycine cleavage system protein P-like pyridoxal-binding family